MKRILLLSVILIILLTVLCGCSAKAEFPSSEEVREIIPESISIDISEHLPVIETPRTLADVLGGIPRTFTLDESAWEEDFSETDSQYYRRRGDSKGTDYICVYKNGDVSVSTREYDLYYTEGRLSDVYFTDSRSSVYIDTETWSYGFDHGAYHYYIDYTNDDLLLIAGVSEIDDGLSFCYEDGIATDLSYYAYRSTDTIEENFNAFYNDDGTLDCIYYHAYPRDDNGFLSTKTIETTYDSNYISEDAPEEKAVPEATQAPQATEKPQPTEKPERSGFFGKVLDEIEKDFNNIKEDIAEDFR